MTEFYHYGMPKRSGRYPYGSGERPYQSSDIYRSSKSMVEKSIRKRTEVAKSVGLKLKRKQLTPKPSLNLNEKTTLKKGSKVQHVTGVEMNKIRPGQLYVTQTEKDNELYKGFLGANLKRMGYSPKEAVLTLKRDLKAPSANEQYEIFKDMFKNDREKIINSLSEYLLNKKKFETKEEAAKNLSSRKLSDLYIEFTNSFETSGKAQNDFYSELKKRGYNAVLDEHDRLGSWMQGEKPLIIMDALNTIGKIELKDISTKDLIEAINKALEKR